MSGTNSRLPVFLLSAGHFFNDFYCNFLPVLLPVIMPRLGLSLTMSGLLVMVLSITSNLLQPVFGFFMDKHNLNRLLLPVIPFGSFCICSIGYVGSAPVLFCLIALTGLSISAFHPLGSALVTRVSPPEKLGSSMSYYIAGGNVGFALAPLIIVAFIGTWPMEQLPWLITPSLLLSLLFYAKGLTGYSTIQKATPGQSPPLLSVLRSRSVLGLNLAMGLRGWAHFSASVFLPLLLIESGCSQLVSGLILTLFLAGCAVGGLVGGYLGDRFSHKKIIVYSLLLGIFPTAYFYCHPGAAPLSLAALFLAGACLLAPQPSSIVWAQKLMPDNAAMASGMMMGFCFGIGSIGNVLTATLAEQIGLSTAMLLTALPVAGSAFVAALTKFPEQAGAASKISSEAN